MFSDHDMREVSVSDMRIVITGIFYVRSWRERSWPRLIFFGYQDFLQKIGERMPPY